MILAAGCEEIRRTPHGEAASIPAAPSLAVQKGGESPAPGFAPPIPLQPISATGGSALTGPEYYRGSGTLIGATSLAEAPVTGNGRVSLNFAEADIREVVDIVLGDTLGLSYIIDPQVQGTVLARTSEPLDREDVIPALENILALNGAALRLVDGVYHVVPLGVAARSLPQAGTVVPPGARADGFAVTIIPLRFASAESILSVVATFVPADRVFQADPSRNLLIFAGTSTESSDLADLVRLFDVDWMAGMSVALIPVEMAEATELVAELQTVFGQDAAGPLQGMVRFIPITRMNAILAISPEQTYLDRASLWIKRLDRGEGSASRRIYVYYVQNSRAADLADILSQVFASGRQTEQATFDPQLAPGLSAVDITTPSRRATALAEGEREPGGSASEPLRPAAYVAEGRAGAIGRGAGLGVLVQESGDVRIIADEKNNALVILATSAEHRMIEATLRRLDVVPLQVLIEATIAEVQLTDELEYGLEWFFHSGDASAVFSQSGVVAPVFPTFAVLFDQADAQVLLTALTEITDVHVISSPQLLVLDNQSASLQVGDEVPILTETQSDVVGGGSTSVNNAVEYRDTGVLLEITPRVNAGGVVVLDIVQEVSDAKDLDPLTTAIPSPTITVRRIETTVAVQSGETVALGGLIRDNRSESESGVPFLSDIPVLGHLFKTTREGFLRTELMILITPTVISNVMDARAMTEELRSRMRSLAPLEERVFGASESLPAVVP